MSRIPYPKLETLSDAKRAFATAPGRRMLNVIRMAMHTPDPMWDAQKNFSITAIGPSLIGAELREIVVLRVGALSHSDYELHHHRTIARALGMADAVIEAAIAGDYAALAPDARAVARFTSEVVTDVSPSDDTIAATRALFSDAAIFEMVGIIGIYMMNARVIAVGGCAVDEVAVARWDDAEIGGD